MNKIVVLGAGYAGLTAAVNLAARTKHRDDVHITLVNAAERFTERLRLHQVASGQRVADFRIPELLRDTGVEFVRGWVTGLDATARTVRVDDQRVLEFDTLVYALGSVARTSTVPGADIHAYTLDSTHDAELLARRLSEPGAPTVAVCGSGLTGVEAAAEIAEQHPAADVVLLGRQEPGAALGERARAHVRAALDRLGVRVRDEVEIVKVLPGSVELAGGESVTADVVLWTSGVTASPLASAAGLEVDELGRIVTDSSLRSVTHPHVYAVGDAAAVRQRFGVLHGTCQSGMPTGVHAAVSITAELKGRRPKAFRFGYLHTPVSLGRHDAVVQFTRPDHSPKRLVLTGRRAVWYKETVSAAPWPSFARMRTMPRSGSFAWRRGGRYTR
ncbi:NAD(P)/FAD-dependent oxidoreductase [Saccharomonospora cyanea]|uniref:NADH dehydrogenase, FAD-containing subunit n=1 Tax=Saccharomonospora cyanea NA-134 TaxID=882082 RepID=H5XGX7_9PSEU|nr:FAD-dependent oxidoreductase [Saccharomonospora cyanea]EHR62704.1 NADH dehydrogenase, FAD-containing subunit [Saccharomonospora cyanea NA-134]